MTPERYHLDFVCRAEDGGGCLKIIAIVMSSLHLPSSVCNASIYARKNSTRAESNEDRSGRGARTIDGGHRLSEMAHRIFLRFPKYIKSRPLNSFSRFFFPRLIWLRSGSIRFDSMSTHSNVDLICIRESGSFILMLSFAVGNFRNYWLPCRARPSNRIHFDGSAVHSLMKRKNVIENTLENENHRTI